MFWTLLPTLDVGNYALNKLQRKGHILYNKELSHAFEKTVMCNWMEHVFSENCISKGKPWEQTVMNHAENQPAIYFAFHYVE